MENEQWVRVQEIFAELCDLPASEQVPLLDKLCDGDNHLRSEVASLLDFHDQSESFLETPAMEELVELLDGAHKLDEMPKMIDHYRVGKMLGKGGMGSVFLAERDQGEPARVALKVINSSMDLEDFSARFKYEHRALAMMDHENVAKVYDAGTTEDGRPFFTLEYVEGPELTLYCDRQKLTIRDRIKLFLQVCSGVEHAHSKGVIHRDLKPSNILVCNPANKPVSKIIDFGIAKIIDSGQGGVSQQTVTGTLLGTPAYMSPEQADFTDVDVCSDVYSLGAVLYHVLTGEPPFDENDLEDASLNRILRIIREQIPEKPSVRVGHSRENMSQRLAADRSSDPKSLVKALSGDLDLILLKALEKDAAQRYPSVAAFAQDLEAYLDHKPITARSRDTIYLLKKFVNRHRTWVTIGAFLLIATLFGNAGLYFGLIKAQVERDRAIAAEAATKQAAEEALLLNSLFIQILDFADPKAPGGGEEVSDMLAIAESKLMSLEDKPQYHANLMLTLGKIYISRGAYGKAQISIDKALAGFGQLPGKYQVELVKANYYQALCLLRTGDYARAEKIFEATIREQKALLGQDHPETLRSIRGLADVLSYSSDHLAALEHYNQVLARQLATLGEEHMSTQVTRYNRATTLAELGRLDEAALEFEQTWRIRRKILYPNHPHVLSSLYGIARTLYGQGKYEETLAPVRESYEQFSAVHEVGHPDLAASANLYALTLQALGLNSEAEALFIETIDSLKQKVGDNHLYTLIASNNLANLYKDMDKLEEALEVKQNELMGWAVFEKSHNGPNTLYSKITLGQIYNLKGQYARAEQVFQEILIAYRIKQPRDRSRLGVLLASYGKNLSDAGDYDSARPHLLEAQKILGNDHSLASEIADYLERIRVGG